MKQLSPLALSAVALAVAAACIYSVPASANDQPRCSRSSTVTQDVEGAGHLTATSHWAAAAKRFEVMDTNKDGKVTAAEISASRGAESIAWASKLTSPREKISALDTNKDGALTPKEYADSSQRMFDNLDVDGNGVLSDDEMLMPTKGRGTAAR